MDFRQDDYREEIKEATRNYGLLDQANLAFCPQNIQMLKILSLPLYSLVLSYIIHLKRRKNKILYLYNTFLNMHLYNIILKLAKTCS